MFTSFTDSLRVISLELAIKVKKRWNIIPGQKLCGTCRVKLEKLIQVTSSSEEPDDAKVADASVEQRNIEVLFSAAGVSPLKTGGLHTPGKIRASKRKLSTVLSTVKSKVSRSFNITPEEFDLDEEIENEEDVQDIAKKAKRFDELMEQLKEKVSNIDSARLQIHFLTLAPSDWSLKQIMHFFGVSDYVARKAKALVASKGILAMPDEKKGRALNEKNIKIGVIIFSGR